MRPQGGSAYGCVSVHRVGTSSLASLPSCIYLACVLPVPASFMLYLFQNFCFSFSCSFLSDSTLEEAGNERASEQVSGGGRRRTCSQAGQSNHILIVDAQTESPGGYEHRLCSWLWVCPWAGCVTAFLNCKMGVEVMPTSQVALCRAHVQPAGNQAQLLLSPVTGVCSD